MPKPLSAAGKQLVPGNFAALPGWRGDNHAAALETLLKSCARMGKSYGDAVKASPFLSQYPEPAAWQDICARARAAADARDFFETNFTPYLVVDGEKESGLVTGYYEASLRGSYSKSAKYNVPIYKMPPDKYLDLTRGEIMRGALSGKNLELLYVDDPVAAFVLHVQGSGIVKMDDGGTVRIGFAGKTRQPYYSIGKTFEARGLMAVPDINMPNIEKYLRANPSAAPAILASNPSYIFFKEIVGDGPIGAQGVALTPGRSLAVDRSVYPLGLPVWVDLPHPQPDKPRLQRLMVAQDTGSAILGTIRGDYFWGAGEDAKLNAGLMRSRGNMYILLPKTYPAVSQR